MSAITGSTHSKHEGLLQIKPPNIVFCPIDLNPEDVPMPNSSGQLGGSVS